MKQLLHDLRTGDVEVVEVPRPTAARGHLVVRVESSVVSPGTERMLISFGKAGMLEKALQQPERVKEAVTKIERDGVASTVKAVASKLAQPLPMGYSSAGVVLEVGEGVAGFQVGDRVACNGPHAGTVLVPANLCAAIPESVTTRDAAFVPVSAVALHATRLAQVSIGETVAVIGLGLVGQIACQILRAQGCRVLGIDLRSDRLETARSFGVEPIPANVEDIARRVLESTEGRGADAVLVAAAGRNSEPLRLGVEIARRRGRVVLIGESDVDLDRRALFEKELELRVSSSYGPGRYDEAWERGEREYPADYVRWTAKLNFETVLDLIANGSLQVGPLTTHVVPIDEAPRAYQLVEDGSALGLVFEYPGEDSGADVVHIDSHTAGLGDRVRSFFSGGRAASVGVIGAGNYATRTLLPALEGTGVRRKIIASLSGMSGFVAARNFDFETTTTRAERVLEDPEIDCVFVLTRHDSHVDLATQALEAGKHVWIEKPLAIDLESLRALENAFAAVEGTSPVVMAGYNRRFAPHIVAMKESLDGVTGPRHIIMTVRAGALSREHWLNDPRQGGGRVVGEAIHFIDLARHLTGSEVRDHDLRRVGRDGAIITLEFEDSSVASIHYVTTNHPGLPKEEIEVHVGERSLRMQDYRTLTGRGFDGFEKEQLHPVAFRFRNFLPISAELRLEEPDKGHTHAVAAFLKAVEAGRPSPIAFWDAVESNRVALQLVDR